MKKKILYLAVFVLFVLLGLIGYYYKDKFLNSKSKVVDTQTQENIINYNGTGKIDELISKNFDPKMHHLDLRRKNLGAMPDICAMIGNHKIAYDIWTLDLADNGISQIDKKITCLPNLSELNLSFNKIKKIENLEKLTFLKKLDLGNNEISDITGLDNLLNLTELHLGYNKISKIEGLQNLKSLTSLKLQHNEISSLDGILMLSNLEELKLEYNKLDNDDIKNLKALKKLKVITVGENPGIDQNIIDKLNNFSLKNMNK